MTDVTQPIIYSASALSGSHQSSTDPVIDGPMWARIFDYGDGITGASSLAAGALTLSGDTWSIAAFNFRLDGFLLPVAAQSGTFAAVVANTVYSVCIISDPSRDTLTDAGGRLQLWAGPKASIVTPSGGKVVTLWEVTRTPSTPMSSSTAKADLRLYASETSYFPNVAVPDGLGSLALGRRAVLSDGSEWVRVPSGSSSAKWVPVGASPWAQFNAITSPAQKIGVATAFAVNWQAPPSAQQQGGSWTAGSYLIKVPTSGVWSVQSTLNVSAAQTGRAFVQLLANVTAPAVSRSPFGNGEDYASASYQAYLAAGTQIKLEAYLSNAATVQSGSYINLTRLSA